MARKLPVLQPLDPKAISIHRPKSPSIIAARPRVKNPPRPTRENPLIISASELRDFLRCRVKWYWRHQARIETREKKTPLVFGGVTHDIIEPYYMLPEKKRGPKNMAKLAKARLLRVPPEELTIEEVELIAAMCVGYADWSRPRDKDLGIANVRSEEWFDLPLDAKGTIRVRGKIDVVFDIAKLKKTMGCFEHKTASQIKMDMVDLNLQLSVYLWALRVKYPKMKRYLAYRNVLRKQMPGPRVRAALFAREGIERMDDEIDQWVIDTQRAAGDMLDAAIYPSPMDSCSWSCDYQIPCLMRGKPDDLREVLERDYKPKESRHGGTTSLVEEDED